MRAAEPRLSEGSLQPLDQPRAERVEPLETGEVDVDRARAGMPAARVLDQAFELGGALHRPGAGGTAARRDRLRLRRQAKRRSSCRPVIAGGAAQALSRQALSRPEKHGHTAPRMELSVRIERWPIAGAFAISRGRKTEAVVVVAELNDGIHRGRGESVPYARYGETPDGSLRQASRPCVRHYSRASTAKRFRRCLAAGAARNALDCAYWDVNARRSGRRAYELAGLAAPKPLTTAYTISLGFALRNGGGRRSAPPGGRS